jgi:poly-gamma-glutamate synthesis protein (capsule biosynthesis protein)
MRLDHPVIGIAPTPSGAGYRLATADGGVFTFGDAAFHGSAVGALAPDHEVVAIAARPHGAGYWVASAIASVTIAAAGDVHGEARVASLLASGGSPLAGVASVLAAADVAMVNLETTVGTLGEPLPKTYVFQAPVALLRAVRDAGVDVVSLANNHAMDYGADALLETIANAHAVGLVTVGAGRNADEAYAPAVIELGGRRVAVVGLTRVNSSGFAGPERAGVASALDVDRATAAVRAAAALAEHVVVMIHWGIERDPCPDGGVRALADQLVAAGADVIAGHHPHVLQGIQETGRSIVAYSLANFVWYHSRPPSDRTGVLTATLDRAGVRSHGFVPAVVDSTGSPQPLAGTAADDARRELAALVPGAGTCPR